MKTQIKSLIAFFVVIGIYSCNDVKTSYDKLTESKIGKVYLNSINKSFEEIRNMENKDFLVAEDYDLLRYEHTLGEGGDTYQVTYRFDKKGCFEVGMDAYIDRIDNANRVVVGFKNYFNENKEFQQSRNDNNLFRWETLDQLLVAELDYGNAAKGRVALTIFAYE